MFGFVGACDSLEPAVAELRRHHPWALVCVYEIMPDQSERWLFNDNPFPDLNRGGEPFLEPRPIAHEVPGLASDTDVCSACGDTRPVHMIRLVSAGRPNRPRLACVECLWQTLEAHISSGDTDSEFEAWHQANEWGALEAQGTPNFQAVDRTQDVLKAAPLVTELARMIAKDPARGTEHETVFLDHTRTRTREIGQALYEIGGHPMMQGAHEAVAAHFGQSARALESAWDMIGDWRA